jgi:predicted phosphohydrolase
MKFRLISDLHLEFLAEDFHKTKLYSGNPPKSLSEQALELIPVMPDEKEQVLILAGDICNARDVLELSDFFTELNDRFKLVIYIMGNHEYYFHNYKKTYEYVKWALECFDNIIVMNNNILELDDCLIVAGTMWTNFDNGNPLSIEYARGAMSDYRLVNNGSAILSPYDTIEEHKKFMLVFDKLNEYPDKPLVVVTHHAPSYKSVTPEFVGSPLNPAFVNNLDNFISQLNIKYWIHGHVHSKCDYMIDNTRVIANPRGYGSFNSLTTSENPEFNPELVVEL